MFSSDKWLSAQKHDVDRLIQAFIQSVEKFRVIWHYLVSFYQWRLIMIAI